MAKSQMEIEAAADKARKAKVDNENKRRAKLAEEEIARLANTPLSPEEKAFIAKIKPMMNKGRSVDQPTAAQIGRYGRLLLRKDVKQNIITD